MCQNNNDNSYLHDGSTNAMSDIRRTSARQHVVNEFPCSEDIVIRMIYKVYSTCQSQCRNWSLRLHQNSFGFMQCQSEGPPTSSSHDCMQPSAAWFTEVQFMSMF